MIHFILWSGIVFCSMEVFFIPLQSDDPDKQRRWEEKENKKAAKKRAPKMKQMKVC